MIGEIGQTTMRRQLQRFAWVMSLASLASMPACVTMSRPDKFPEPIQATTNDCPDLSGTYRDLAAPSPFCRIKEGNLVSGQCSLGYVLKQLWSAAKTVPSRRSDFFEKVVIIDKWKEDKLKFRVRQDGQILSEDKLFVGMTGEYMTLSCSGGALVFGSGGSDSMGGSGFALGSLSEKLYKAKDGSLVMHVSGVAVGVFIVVPIIAGGSNWLRWEEATPENITQEHIERELGQAPPKAPPVEYEEEFDFVNP